MAGSKCGQIAKHSGSVRKMAWRTLFWSQYLNQKNWIDVYVQMQ